MNEGTLFFLYYRFKILELELIDMPCRRVKGLVAKYSVTQGHTVLGNRGNLCIDTVNDLVQAINGDRRAWHSLREQDA